MIKKFATLVVVVAALILAFAATKPDAFRVQRETTIKASPEKIATLVSDFHQWRAWSPWEKLDPAMQSTFSGAASGKGAIYAWSGNDKVGAGRMEITAASLPSAQTPVVGAPAVGAPLVFAPFVIAPYVIDIQLDFLHPFKGHNITEFTFEPRGTSTKVVWLMHGPSPYLSKLMSVFVSMDNMIGKDFEAGLASLEAVAASSH
ncbi:MAG TPA: polyketide cyclase [Janthinobacterium sp.]|nr:polyketide cyclase [Janthinobacterium sp.]